MTTRCDMLRIIERVRLTWNLQSHQRYQPRLSQVSQNLDLNSNLYQRSLKRVMRGRVHLRLITRAVLILGKTFSFQKPSVRGLKQQRLGKIARLRCGSFNQQRLRQSLLSLQLNQELVQPLKTPYQTSLFELKLILRMKETKEARGMI